ncbi:MAG: aspartate--tRNA ligase, partial [Kiritimatiellaeota bacterium]|nr:aspartate--tRNA ligase [Kiritimatiellota bacterium]
MMRTHNCGELKKGQVGARVKLCGWANTVRDHGGVIFIDLRDRYGLTQVLFDPSDNQAAWDVAQGIRGETCIQIEGRVTARPDDMINPKLPTGEIEVRADQITVFNRAKTPPFPLDEDAEKVDEELKLTYRYLDLRRPHMQRNLIQRHKIINTVRNFLDGENFLEIETPILTKSTPEGARDYLVPSRVNPGMFYALPQAPQQYKQLLMMSGMDRYFQIARCFRDEDLRADRQPEFTQIDVELSFLSQEDIFKLIDGMLARIMRVSGHGEITLPIPRMPYAEAMNRFGSDKPDLRFGMEMVDLSDTFKATTFRVFANVLASGGVVKAINAKGLAGISLGQADEWTKIA